MVATDNDNKQLKNTSKYNINTIKQYFEKKERLLGYVRKVMFPVSKKHSRSIIFSV